jgi:predicted metal-dependent phosphoesterase TrpH
VGDFHIHSVYSDGISTPEEIVKRASSCVFKYISITDHDSVAGVAEARRYGRKYGITVIPGIELSTRFDGIELHILGYGFNYEAEEIVRWSERFRELRWNRVREMITRLEGLGVILTEDDVRNEFGGHFSLPCRPHIARTMHRLGIVENTKEAFEKYIGNSSPAYVEFEDNLSTAEAVELIKRNRGIAILAHPVSSGVDGRLDEILETGIDGIEVFHPSCGSENEDMLLKFCKEHKLIVTGGSDSHDLFSMGSIRLNSKRITPIIDGIKSREGLI